MTFKRAIARRPGIDFSSGITNASLGRPDLDLALSQHAGYCRALTGLGLDVSILEPLDGYPDSTFVEDTAVMTPRIGIIARPGHPSRLGEERSIAPLLEELIDTVCIEPSGTLDGGDVIAAGREYFVGISDRTNEDGARQLEAILSRAGYGVTIVPPIGGLHLKSSVNYLADNTVVIAEHLAGREEFSAYRKIIVPSNESYAANSLWINGTVLVPTGNRRTAETLEKAGFRTAIIDLSEFRKMDGGLTCLSLRF